MQRTITESAVHEPVIRAATQDDIPELLEMIRDLAEYHGERDRVTVTEQQLADQIFSGTSPLTARVVEAPADAPHSLNGYSLWYAAFSPWEGSEVMHLEDLYVRPESRGTGAGKALLRNLAVIADEHQYGHIQWMVLKSNVSGAQFYVSQGAGPMSDWDIYKLDREAIAALAGQAPAAPAAA
ncbi:MAG: GNAT family N-acetyltransferase [Agrococcus casei]|uniref:GNAT family N-acetyltransferase n=2 Tax=Agrococcus casei TaxID=343512 RepID=UPI003F8DB6AE